MTQLKILERTQFGNPLLRRKAKPLTLKQIKSAKIQRLIKNMYYTLDKKKYDIGLAAPQVGQSLALFVVGIKATPSRPKLEAFNAAMINPKILEKQGKPKGLWEGCISMGAASSPVFAKAIRYPRVRIHYLDEQAQKQTQTFNGLKAHLIQHEIDHLQGILFVDRVEDTKTYMNLSEYKQRIVRKRSKHAPKKSTKN